ncbi:MarR family winged helix-turn-helix transcriptional regulator [Priestia endophytica]|uniref:MarR family winged helix-turn-helix transcriptional regulator n=1 Tax=Priestia endophytica TaxID=135735 RepID=UPI000DCA4DE8|nr:MarR family transcriptional regulator [Priestia endophytica]RAS71560.1 MarR family transcriptional regulator [Priestia endophytica]
MSNNENYMKFEDHLCFTLYAGSRTILRLYRPHLEKLNLTYPQYLVLLVLWEKKQSTVKEIGKLLDLDSGTLTPMLKRMEAANLVERRRDEKDERIVTVKLTEKGSSLQEKARCIPQALIELAGMTEEEIKTLNKAIKKLIQTVKHEGLKD